MTFEDLMAAFAEKLGIEGLVREDGVCAVEIDGMVVSIVHIEQADAIVLHGTVGDAPPEAEGRFAELLLRANHLFDGTEGATFSQDAVTKRYALQRLLPLAILDADSLATELERFANALERWKKLLEDFRPTVGDGVEAAPRAGGDGPAPHIGNGIMNV
jgi:hypothetical protein